MVDITSRLGRRRGDLTKVRRFNRGHRSFLIGIFLLKELPPRSDIYPIDDADEAGEVPVAKARRLGHIEVATLP